MNDVSIAAPLKIYLIAGEASGDLLGAHLMQSIRQHYNGQVKFYGIGGERMTAEGLNSLFPYYELSMMGFLEILPHLFNISARLHLTVEDVLAKQPDIIVTIDSPGFNFRIVERLRKEKVTAKFVHYVAPTVWAYKPERAKRCKALFDHLLVLLPFEPPYFEKAGLPCTFVGHPVVAETPVGDGPGFRKRFEIADNVPIFCLLPGSRKGEVDRHMPIFARAITMLAAQYPNLAIAVAAPANVINFVTPHFKGCPFRTVIMSSDEDKKGAMAASAIALVKSGTVALEVAMANTPMIVTYRVNPISAWLVKKMVVTKYANLINILQGKEIVPELLQEQCTPQLLANALASILTNSQRRHAQSTAFKEALASLLPGNSRRPSDIAAQTILRLAPGKQ